MIKRAVKTKRRPTKKTGRKKKIAIVVSLFNESVTRNLLKGSLRTLKKSGYPETAVTVVTVPGAFEIPLVAKRLAQTGKFAGIVALGCVIRGETPHFEYVSLATTLGCLEAQMDTGCPVAFGVLTVENEAQAVERSGPDNYNKGREAVLALLDTITTLESL